MHKVKVKIINQNLKFFISIYLISFGRFAYACGGSFPYDLYGYFYGIPFLILLGFIYWINRKSKRKIIFTILTVLIFVLFVVMANASLNSMLCGKSQDF